MKKIDLYFSDFNKPELYRIAFTHPLSGEQRISIRGKDIGAFSDAYTFQWTQAVKAMCVLFIRSVQNPNYVLEGVKGSLASSLDYSISKNTQWLSDLFGVDVSGKPLARRYFKRTNSDRIYPGPVGISLNQMLFDNFTVNIFFDCKNLNKSEYATLANKIEGNLYVEQIVVDKSVVSIPNLKSQLCKVYSDEFKDSIYRTDIFLTKNIKNSVLAINKAGFYNKISGKEFNIYNSKLEVQGRLGIGIDYSYAKSLLNDLKIVGSSTLIGPAVIFNYLSNKYQLKLNYNFNFPHAINLVNKIIEGELSELPDIVFAAIAPAATLHGSKFGDEYIPLMLMPDSSQKIIANKNSLKSNFSLNNATYSLLNADPSIPALMLEELNTMGHLHLSKVEFRHDEPDETFSLMREGDPDLRAALFFPHYNLNCLFNNCIVLPELRARPNSQEVVMFVHRKKASVANFMLQLEAIIRDAWLDLRVEPSRVDDTVEVMLDEEGEYYKSVVRFCGLHNLKLA